MQIDNNSVVAIHYTLTNPEGTVLDSSAGREPLHYMQGHGNLIAGMEEGLQGKMKGDKCSLKISPEKGYGVRDESLVQHVAREAFGNNDVQPGMKFNAGSQGSHYVITVVEVNETEVVIDGNHDLAGVTLHFDVEVMDVRMATDDEIAHGHVHGPGGHHH
ncbi:MAG: peptidylprolyl isomerase [Flavobacteriales bacterium]